MDVVTFAVAAALLAMLAGVLGLALGRYAGRRFGQDSAAALNAARLDAARLGERARLVDFGSLSARFSLS